MPLLHLSSVCLLYIVCIVVRLASGQPGRTAMTTKISFARTPLKYDAAVGKVSVAPEIDVDDLEKIIDVHNLLRRRQGAADMQLLRWHSFLATLAEEWVDLCVWDHGQLSQDPNVRSFLSVGQSLLASQSGSVDVGDVIREWYGQETNYDFQTSQCRQGDLCELYTQVVWSSSREVGCATRKCAELSGLNWRNASFVVCNYAPSGGWANEGPYRIGKACTKCETGGRWCEKGLCNSFCQESGLKCTCDADCGCGNLNANTCSCNCGVGWHGPDCSELCLDRDSRCGKDPSWSLSACSDEDDNGRFLQRACPVTCQLCQAANSSVPAACVTPSKEPAAELSRGQKHLIPPINLILIILILWSFAAAAWMLNVQWMDWSCCLLEQASPSVATWDSFTTWNLESPGRSVDQKDRAGLSF